MKTVFKYTFRISDEFSIDMQKHAEILTVQMQNNSPCIWAKVDTDSPKEERNFRLSGTGHSIGEDVLIYIGSFQMEGGKLVFHLFEKV